MQSLKINPPKKTNDMAIYHKDQVASHNTEGAISCATLTTRDVIK